MKKRCAWVEKSIDLYIDYHDKEWGIPVHDDKKHFEFLVLEGAQAGLSWLTILKKREGYRKAFANFDVNAVANLSENYIKSLYEDPSIIRNRLKINAVITNAKQFLKIQEEFGSFDKYIWSFVGNTPIVNRHKDSATVPANSIESDMLSKDLKKRGFKFVGSTIMYSHMQACGLINDHTTDCFRFQEITSMQ